MLVQSTLQTHRLCLSASYLTRKSARQTYRETLSVPFSLLVEGKYLFSRYRPVLISNRRSRFVCLSGTLTPNNGRLVVVVIVRVVLVMPTKLVYRQFLATTTTTSVRHLSRSMSLRLSLLSVQKGARMFLAIAIVAANHIQNVDRRRDDTQQDIALRRNLIDSDFSSGRFAGSQCRELSLERLEDRSIISASCERKTVACLRRQDSLSQAFIGVDSRPKVVIVELQQWYQQMWALLLSSSAFSSVEPKLEQNTCLCDRKLSNGKLAEKRTTTCQKRQSRQSALLCIRRPTQ